MAKKENKAKVEHTKTIKTAKPLVKRVATKNSRTPQVSAKETNLIRRVTMREPTIDIQEFRTGDTLNVYVRVKEGEKERVQLYKGVVTKIQGSGVAKSFTVRKISAGVGVERTFPFNSSGRDRVEVVTTGKVRKSRLFYLREREGKAAKIESELVATVSTSADKSAETTKAE